MFSIQLSDETYASGRDKYYRGEIHIGSFHEGFRASASYWRKQDYERHWLKAVSLILEDRRTQTAFITTIHDPMKSDHIVWWPMWQLDDKIYVRNQILFFDQLAKPFDFADPFIHIPRRRSLNEDEKVSEWVLAISALAEFKYQLLLRIKR